MTSKTIFITGTDTGVGKTRVSCGLLRAAREAGIRACGFKPVASGCRHTPQGLRNPDALEMQRCANTSESYALINPYAYAPAIAPHIAAQEMGQHIDPARISRAHDELARRHALIIAEGAGGWMVPLNNKTTFADYVGERSWPVVLVVGMRLGSINHALLSAEAISRGNRLLGWIACELSPRQDRLDQNVAELAARIPAPLLGRVGPRRKNLSAEFAELQRVSGMNAAI